MKKLNPLLPLALQAAQLIVKDNSIPKEYASYANQLGAVVRTSGLLPALSLFTDINKKGTKRYKILQCIYAILQPKAEDRQQETVLLDYVIQQVYQITDEQKYRDPHFDITKQQLDPNILQKLEKDILRANTALKLALRNYERTKTETA